MLAEQGEMKKRQEQRKNHAEENRAARIFDSYAILQRGEDERHRQQQQRHVHGLHDDDPLENDRGIGNERGDTKRQPCGGDRGGGARGEHA